MSDSVFTPAEMEAQASAAAPSAFQAMLDHKIDLGQATSPMQRLAQGAMRLGQSAWERPGETLSAFADGIARTVGTARDAWTGDLPTQPGLIGDAAVERALDMAGMVGGGGIGLSRLAGPAADGATLGMFVGPRGAANLGEDALADMARSNRMRQKGASATEIKEATGWERGADGKPRLEIDDSGSAVTGPIAEGDRLGDRLSHPTLFQAYPDFADIRLSGTPQGAGRLGSWGDGMVELPLEAAPGTQRSILLHELQHAVQERERFARGTSSLDSGPEGYRTAMGEVEARNVQARADWDAAARRSSPAAQTEDVPRALQTRGEGGARAEAIDAFHGSPHEFDTFDISRLGSGFGSQAHGHGLYFAQGRDEALRYALTPGKWDVTVDGFPVQAYFKNRVDGLENAMAEHYRLAGYGNFGQPHLGDIYRGLADDMAQGEATGLGSGGGATVTPRHVESLRRLHEGLGDAPTDFASLSRLYDVSLDVDPARLLDLDAPLASSPAVIEALGRAEGRFGGAPTVRDAVHAAGERMGPPEVSRTLGEMGFQGSRYRDPRARALKLDRNNIVLFDDAPVQVKRSYPALPTMFED